MKLGVSLTTAVDHTTDARQAGRDLIARAAAARDHGFDSLFVGDRHVMPGEHYFQAIPLLARLLAASGAMEVGALFQLPLYHPVLLAEQIGTLATLATGPLTVGVMLGYGEAQFAAFGQTHKTRPSRFEEHLAIVRRLLAGERLTYHGRYHTLDDVAIAPTPPTPVPIWIAASARPAVERAARLGDGWLVAPSLSDEEIETAATTYRQAAVAAGRPATMIIRRNVYVGENDREAEETVAKALGHGSLALPRELLIVGGPERVLSEFRRYHELGFGHILIRNIVSDQATMLACYDRLARHVLPELRRW